MKKAIYTSDAPEPIGPYNQAIMHDATLYVSGQIAINPATNELIEGDIEAQTHQVMRNIQAILKEADMTFEHVLKCSIFISSMQDFGAINRVYGSYFGDIPPARETVEVSQLPKGVDVEISCIAAK